MCTYLDQVGSTYYFRRVVPLELRPFILTRTGKPRSEWKISLGTKDRTEAKRLLPDHTIRSDAEIDAARLALSEDMAKISPEKPLQLVSKRAADAEWQQLEWANAGAELAEREQDAREARQEGREPIRQQFERVLRKSTAEVTPLEAAFLDALRDAKEEWTAEREAEASARLRKAQERRGLVPAIRVSHPAPVAPPNAPLPLITLFDEYAKEAGMSPVTVQDWKGLLRHLIRFLGHDDANQITVEDIDGWRDTLLTETTKRGTLRSAKTVKEKYLSALRSTLNFAVSKRKLKENVAAKVVVRVPKQVKLRDRDFTNDEANAILTATLKPHADASDLDRRARRWIPWLCAYTGARVNEISQLRGSDVAKVDGVWTIHITPEAGRVKSGEARRVPLHPHLIEQGFLTFVEDAGKGELFYDPEKVRKPGAANRHVSKVGERLAAWVRDDAGVTDPNVSPNHGWRHLFKTRALQAGMPERIADAIQGHAARSVGQTYGSVPVAAMYEALKNLPQFIVSI